LIRIIMTGIIRYIHIVLAGVNLIHITHILIS